VPPGLVQLRELLRQEPLMTQVSATRLEQLGRSLLRGLRIGGADPAGLGARRAESALVASLPVAGG